MQVLRLAVLALIIALGSAVADTRQEIDHLLSFVEQTPCTYERNGTFHSGPEARDHINKKYEYYRKKIKTAEDFIEYSATKSMLSGNKYTIQCPGKEVVYASDWLLAELKDYRSKMNR